MQEAPAPGIKPTKMTQEQYKEMEKHIRIHCPYRIHKENAVDWSNGFERGADYILSNPTDFGLVSIGTMFEFCEWAVPNQVDFPKLFQLFTTQNKEK
jgi:hypothetical protein